MLENLTPILLKAALAFLSFIAFAIDVPDYGSKNFSPIGDTPTYFINESIPVSTRTADTTAGDSTAQEAAAPMPCVAAAVSSAHRNAGRHARYAPVQRSSLKSRDTGHATRSARANRGEATKTASLRSSATEARSVSKRTVWSAKARGTTKSRAASSAKTTTAKQGKASARHATASSAKTTTAKQGKPIARQAREAGAHPVAIIGTAVLPKARLLTPAEMDRVTVGAVSAVAENQVKAQALGAGAAQTTASASTRASSTGPVAGAPFAYLSSNYSSSQATASAIGRQLAESSGSSHISVAATSGVQINAAGTSIAAGGERSQAQVSLQFYGLSIGHVDLAFGTATAAACCAPLLAAQVTANGRAGGSYSQEAQAFPLSTIPGQVQSRADIAVVSSSLPIVNAGQMMSLSPRGPPFP
jgi:hypothetical protein